MKKYLSVILSICLLLPLINVANAEDNMLISSAENSEFVDFVASDLYVRSGTEGEKVKDWYNLYQNGFMIDKTVYIDRDYSFVEMPDEFINQCYIRSRKGDSGNKYYTNNNVTDWLTFNINKSATVYIIDYMTNEVLPAWMAENGWESQKDPSVKYKYVTLTKTTITNSQYIHKKHYDVNPGETVTVEIGGYEGKCYNPYTIVVIPDEKKPERVVSFSESELSVPDWENEVAKPSENFITMFKGSNKAFKYGVKENIDVRPIKKDDKYFLPVTYFANVFGAKVEGNVLTHGGITYDLSTGGISENGNYLMEGNELCKIFGKKLTTTVDGLIFVGDSEPNFSAEDVKRILSLYFVNLINIELRTKYAQPGDELIIPDGEYAGTFMKINGKGTEEKNIIVRSETPGGAKFTGLTEIILSGEYMHFKDFYFDKAETSTKNIYVTNAKYCRISDCYFYNCAYSDASPNYQVITLGEYSKYCRVDHNTFERSNGVSIGIFTDDDSVPESLAQYHRVDHNYFKDIRLCTDEHTQSNGRECLMVGSSMIKGRSSFLTCEYNLFEDTYGDGNEIITNKSSDNIYRYNTWFQTRGLLSGLSTRQGDNVVWDRNYMINASHGITSTGHNTKITNNYFFNVDEGSASARIANFNMIERHYKQNINLLIANNIIIDPRVGGIEMGRMYLTLNDSYTYKPRHTKIYNNVVYKMSRDGYFVNDVVSEGTKYKNNITNIEETDIEGVEVRNDKLVLKKGLFYVPENLSELEGKGFYDPDVNLFDDYGNQDGTLDVGIDNFTDEVIEQTYMDIDDVGPRDRWWLPLMRVKPYKVEDFLFSNDVPTNVTPDKTTLYINGGAPYDLDEIVHNVIYPDGRKQRAPYIDLSYEIVDDPNGIFKIEGRRLVTTGNGTGKVKSIFRGVETYFNVIANDSTNNYTDDFSDDKFLKDITKVGTWKVEDGKLKNENPKNTKQYIINHSQFLKDNFKIEFDITMHGSGIASASNAGANGGILLGAQGDKNKEFYSVLFGSGYYKKIFTNDEYRNPTCAGYIMGDLDNGTYHVSVIKNGDWLAASIDGKLAGTLEVGNDFNGNFGFITHTNNMEIDNLSVTPYEPETPPSVQTLNLKFERSDITELNVIIDNPLKEDVIYKFYRNGVWTYDSKEPNFFDHTLQDLENEYDYLVYAVNNKGEILAKGEGNSNLNEIPDTMFYIDNVRFRNGENGTFAPQVYYPNNKGMDTAGIEGIWFDQYYKFDSIPDIFYDQAYIRTRRGFGRRILNSADGGDEWMKFDIHNYPVTVYVIFFTTEATPNWIYNQNWQLTHYQMDVYNGARYITKTNNVYKKKFSCNKGESRTITLGAHSDTSTYHYFVVVVPDKE